MKLKSLFIAFFAAILAINTAFAQSEMVMIHVSESPMKNFCVMTVLEPDNQLIKVDLEPIKGAEDMGKNMITVKNELLKWEALGFTNIAVIPNNTSYQIILRKEKD